MRRRNCSGSNVRTFRRWTRRYEEDGEAGLLDRRLGKASGKRVPTDRAEEVERPDRRALPGLHGPALPRASGEGSRFRLGLHLARSCICNGRGWRPRAPRKGAHRRKRERRPLPGMMLHQDGSRRAWLAGQPALDLIVTLDDATSAIYSAFLTEEEGTASTFRALIEVFSPARPADEPLHRPRQPTTSIRRTPARSTKNHPTQVGRALDASGR